MRDKFKVNHSMIVKLREQMKMPPEELARRAGISQDTYRQIESGSDNPTSNRIVNIADVLGRPIIVFYLNEKEIETELKLPVDHRMNRDESISPEVYLAIRRAHYVIDTIKELSALKTELPNYDANLNAESLADYVRKDLNISAKDIMKRPENQVLKLYKNTLESKYNISIFEQPFKSSGVRAFSLYSDVSAIVLNEQDGPHVKIFSLFHELCHLIRREDGLCSMEFGIVSKQKEEQYCNRFSAAFLMPEIEIKNTAKHFKPIDYESIIKLSKIFCVSKEALLIRLKQLKVIDDTEFDTLTTTNKSFGKKGKGGRKNWKSTYLNRNGLQFVNVMNIAYKTNIVSYSRMLSTLKVNSKYFSGML